MDILSFLPKRDFLKLFFFLQAHCFIFFFLSCQMVFFFFTLQYCIGFAIHQHALPRVYTCSASWTPLPPPSPYHLSGSSQCTSPRLPVSCIKPGLVIHFLYDIIHVLMPFSQIIPHSLSHKVQKTGLYICVSFAVSYTGFSLLSKFHIYVLVYCIDVFLSGLLHSV